MITADLLRAAVGCTAERAEIFAGPLSEACALFEINTPARLAAFLAQLAHESGALKYMAELASGDAYEGRADLGNTQPGDGRRFKGHGPIQITGRFNHRAVRPALLLAGYEDVPDFEAEPERLTEPRWGCAAAAEFWSRNGLNAMADRGEFDRISKAINRGNPDARLPANGDADRRARWERAKAAVGADAQATASEAPSAPISPLPAPSPPRRYMPAGEFIPEEPTMAPFIAAALQAVLPAVPKLIETFGSGSEVSKRNEKAAEVVVSVAKEALGAVNEQDLAERMRTDPEAPAKVRAAVEEKWFAIMDEAGSGGIDGARKADAASRAAGDLMHSASFWVALLLLPLVYLLVLSLIGLIGSASWSDDVRAGLAGSLISAIVGGLVGYYYGQTTSRNRSGA